MYESQHKVIDVIERHGGLWPRDKILLKLQEELGELVKAFRKRDRDNQEEEIGDVAFALLCLAMVENHDIEKALDRAIIKHKTRPKQTYYDI